MDPISVTASIITLIDSAGFIAKTAYKAVQAFHDAPTELAALAERLLYIQAELEQLRSLDNGKRDRLVPEATRRSLTIAFTAASRTLADIEQSCSMKHGRTSIRNRLRWAILDRRTTSKLLERVRDTENHLNTLGQLISIRAHYDTIEALDRIMTSVVNSDPPPYTAQTQTSAQGRIRFSRPAGLKPTEQVVKVFSGLGGSVLRRDYDCCTDYDVSFRWKTPLASILGPYAFMLAVSFRTFPLCSSISLLDSGGVCLTKVIPDNDPLMSACSRGDLITVRDLFRQGEGRPDFVTETNWTPLAFAIRGGSMNMVNFLLDHGASVNWAIGNYQTSPLQWAIWHKRLDIVRLLIERGACLDHVNSSGWTAWFFCWALGIQNQPDMLDYLRLLDQDPTRDLNVRNVEGWTVLRRAAAFGTAAEVTELVRLGADPSDLSSRLSWSALYYAAYFGNNGTFHALLPFTPGSVADMTDARDCTLLHVAACQGHAEIIKACLQAGVDPSRRCSPLTRPEVPQDLLGKMCTAGELAAAEGPDKLRIYIEQLGDRVDEGLQDVEMPEDVEMFWEIKEG